MKCPMTYKLYAYPDEKVTAKGGECLREECAWWSDEHKQCDPTGLLPWLIHIESRLSAIADYLGHGVKR